MKQIIRQIRKNKLGTIINVLGLALGVTCGLVLFLMIQYSTGFDKYHKNGDKVYRIVSNSTMNGSEDHSSGVPIPLIRAFNEDVHLAKIVAPVNYIVGGQVTVFNANDEISEFYEEREGVVYLDENFYKLFDRAWLIGDKSSSLSSPNKVVLSEKIALKYFDNTQIVGRSISIEGIGNLEVSGVIEDYPKSKTDFPFDIIISYKTFEGLSNDIDNWGSISSDFQCYILVENSMDAEAIVKAMPSFADKYYGEDRTDARINDLQPLGDIHYNQDYGNYNYRSISKSNVWAMAMLGFFLIITACINFINLSTAQASQRFKEVGIRKILGSSKSQIVNSFFKETIFVTFISILVAIGLSELALIKINSFLEMDLAIQFSNPTIWIFLLALWLFISALAGFYPAITISRFQPKSVLNGVNGMEKGVGFFLRKTLVVFQFVVSQVLIIGTIITTSQLDFFKEMSVGFKKDGIINITLPDNNMERKKSFKTQLKQLSSSESVSLSYRPPASTSTSITNLFYNTDTSRVELNVQIIPGDIDYIDVFDISLLAGEGLVLSDTCNRLIVNEEFSKELGFETPDHVVGEYVDFRGQEVMISGVVQNFHTFSVKKKVIPVVLYNHSVSYQTASVSFTKASLPGLVENLKLTYANVYPEFEFEYEFMDEQLADFYRSEQRMAELLSIFSIIAIFIGSLGLFGLVSYMANKKYKEIGIRKALGASVSSVVLIFSKEFTGLVLIAFMIAAPISYFGMSQWLQSYTYKIDLSVMMFLAGVIISLGIALVTILYKSIEASLSNPIEALKEE